MSLDYALKVIINLYVDGDEKKYLVLKREVENYQANWPAQKKDSLSLAAQVVLDKWEKCWDDLKNLG